MTLLPKSIRWRFVVWLAFLLAIVLSGFGVTAYQLHRTNRFNELDEELKYRVAAISTTLRGPPRGGRSGFDRDPGPPPDFGDHGENRPSEPPRAEKGEPAGPPPDSKSRDRRGPREFGHDDGWNEFRVTSEITRLFSGSATSNFYYTLWNRASDGVLASSTNAPAGIPRPEQPGKDTRIYFQTRGTLREAWHYTERGHCILVGRSVLAELTASRQFGFWLFTGGAAVLALGVGGGWLIAGRVLQPVKAIGVAATRISAGNLSERINVAKTHDELGQLAGTLNSTFARLEASFDQQKQFTADASHELRTPLAVMISEAQTTLSRERTAAEYRETVEACLETAQQMRRLTESLLELARFDANQQEIRHEPVDLVKTVRSCVELIHPLADVRAIKIQSEFTPAMVRGDASLLQQVVTNLLSNGIHYNKSSGAIHLQTRVEKGEAVLTVTDTGRGIAAEDLPHIFKRFYRADKSRARAEGRSGLGLAICKSIVDAHGGSIEAASEPGAGTSFTVRLPLAAEKV